MKIEHIAFNVPDSKKMADWYIEHLGLSVIRDVGDDNKTMFLGDDGGQTIIEIYSNPAADIPDYNSIHPLVLHIALAVDEIEPTRQRLLDAGASEAGDLLTLPSGDQLLFLRDPWGLALQLAKRTKSLL